MEANLEKSCKAISWRNVSLDPNQIIFFPPNVTYKQPRILGSGLLSRVNKKVGWASAQHKSCTVCLYRTEFKVARV